MIEGWTKDDREMIGGPSGNDRAVIETSSPQGRLRVGAGREEVPLRYGGWYGFLRASQDLSMALAGLCHGFAMTLPPLLPCATGQSGWIKSS